MIAGLILGILLVAQAAPSARDENWAGCKDANPDTRLKACTAVILAGGENRRPRGGLPQRANASRAKQLYDLALQDYAEAIKLNATFVDAIGDPRHHAPRGGPLRESDPGLYTGRDLDPKSAYALYDRGLAYEGLGLEDLAIDDFSRRHRAGAARCASIRATRHGVFPKT